MIYLDTNVLVRMITNDIPEQAHKAYARIGAAEKGAYHIDNTVIVELCFVLEYHDYQMLRDDIVRALHDLSQMAQITVSEEALEALKLYKKYQKLDFVDCLLIVLGGQDGVYSFDKQLVKILGQ